MNLVMDFLYISLSVQTLCEAIKLSLVVYLRTHIRC